MGSGHAARYAKKEIKAHLLNKGKHHKPPSKHRRNKHIRNRKAR